MDARSEPSVGPLASEEIRQGAELLARAFARDPVLGHYLTPGHAQGTAFSAFFRSALWDGATDHSTYSARVEGRLVGVALWAPPDHQPASGSEASRASTRSRVALRRVKQLYPTGLQPLLDGFAALAAHHPVEAHWYLAFVGVDPNAQGHGIGRRLLQPVLKKADQAGVPCYLETPFPETHSFYRSLGFVFQHELRAFGPAPPISSFLRSPSRPR